MNLVISRRTLALVTAAFISANATGADQPQHDMATADNHGFPVTNLVEPITAKTAATGCSPSSVYSAVLSESTAGLLLPINDNNKTQHEQERSRRGE